MKKRDLSGKFIAAEGDWREGLTAAEQAKIRRTAEIQINGAVAARANIAARMGQSYGGDRDVYDALGYNKEPDYETYQAKYERQDIARAVVDRPVRASWRKHPIVEEASDDTEPTKFEMQWNALVKTKKLYHQFSRADRLAGIGAYSVLLMGFNDAAKMSEPVENGKELLYVQAYSQPNASIKTLVKDDKDERFGLPEIYDIKVGAAKGSESSTGQTMAVHWSRVIHIAEDLLEGNVYGQPRLQAILNRLENLELLPRHEHLVLHNGGEDNPYHKLTTLQVQSIKLQLSKGIRLYILARQFQVSQACISAIRDGKC